MVLRRARGYAPLPVHLKDAAAVRAGGGRAFEKHRRAERRAPRSLSASTSATSKRARPTPLSAPSRRTCPGSMRRRPKSSRATCTRIIFRPNTPCNWPRRLDIPLHPVQHHWAHVLSCMAENEIEVPRARRGVGRNRVRSRRHDLGRRISAGRRKVVRARGAFPPVPASGRRSRDQAAAPDRAGSSV